MRRTGLTLSLLAGASLAGCADAEGEGEGQPPNVLIVLLDTLRPDHMGCYGYERDTTPHLDAMADEFFLFENAQSCAPWTAPALISLMTSLYPDHHQVRSHPDPGRLSERAVTLAEVLSERGYATMAITEGGYARGRFGLDQGFQEYHAEGGPSKPSHFAAIPNRLGPNIDLAIELAAREEKPFFLFLHTFEVHSPRKPKDRLLKIFRPDHDAKQYRASLKAAVEAWNERGELDAERANLMLRESLGAEFAGIRLRNNLSSLFDAAAEHGVSFLKSDVALIPELVEWVRDLYDAELRHTDAELQRLWTALREMGKWDDTIVVLVSDHGEGLGDHGRIGHGGLLHEELLRILLMIRAPQSELQPRRINEVVRSVDVMPTLLELTGTRLDGLEMQGVSLLPLLAGESLELEAFGHAVSSNGGHQPHHTIRNATWRLIHDATSGKSQLYDVRNDSRELEDVAEREPEVVQHLLERLGRRRELDARLAERLGTGDSRGIDVATMRELEALGYVGDDDAD